MNESIYETAAAARHAFLYNPTFHKRVCAAVEQWRRSSLYHPPPDSLQAPMAQDRAIELAAQVLWAADHPDAASGRIDS